MDYEHMSRELLLRFVRSMQSAGGPLDRDGLMQALQLHQIELEAQNRQLMAAHVALEESRNDYANLYDFAPVPYCTFSEHGLVEQLNLAAASLLKIPRERAVGQPFVLLAALGEDPTFWLHLDRCRSRPGPIVDQLRLHVAGEERVVEAVSVLVSSEKHGVHIRSALSDITARVSAEQGLARAHAAEQALHFRMQMLDRVHLDISRALAAGGHVLERVLVSLADSAMRLTRASGCTVEVKHDVWPVTSSAEAQASLGVCAPEQVRHVLKRPMRYGTFELATVTVYLHHDDVRDAEEQLATLCDRSVSGLEVVRLRALDAQEAFRLSALQRVERSLEHNSQDGLKAVESALRALLGEVLAEPLADVCTITAKVRGLVAFTHVARSDGDSDSDGDGPPAPPPDHQPVLQHLRTSTSTSTSTSALALSHRYDDPAPSAPLAGLAQKLGVEHLLVVPLTSRGELLGALTMGRCERSQPFDPALIELCRDLADGCARTLDMACVLHELRASLQWREGVLAMISHDLRNPISTIKLSTALLEPDTGSQERRASGRQVQLIRRSVQHVEHMLDDLLATAMLERGGFHVDAGEVDAHELTAEAVRFAEPLAHAKGVKLTHELLGPAPPPVRADRERIQRVLANLIGNALKFTPPGGSVKLQTRTGSGCVRFSVVDSGPGIAPEQLPHLFARYWKGSHGKQGLGLGLYIARAIVDAHGGHIWAESTPGSGAAFHFELPLAAGEKQPAA
jgi:signal transduction histidine kinase/PAS domain-containing protein